MNIYKRAIPLYPPLKTSGRAVMMALHPIFQGLKPGERIIPNDRMRKTMDSAIYIFSSTRDKVVSISV